MIVLSYACIYIVGIDISAGHHGWSLRTLKGVVAEAGAHLERLQAEVTETGGLVFSS